MFAEIRRGDILVHHPYDAFGTSVERFIEQAVDDPDVLAIKHTIYRTVRRLADRPGAGARGRAGQAGRGDGRGDGAVRRGAQHPLGALAGARRRARRLRPGRAEDALQAGHGRAPRGGRRAPLRPHRHRQLPPVHGAAVHRPRAVHLPRGRDRRRSDLFNHLTGFGRPQATASCGWRRRSCASGWSTRSGAAASSTSRSSRRGWC